MSEGNGSPPKPLTTEEMETIIKAAADKVAWRDYGVKSTDYRLKLLKRAKFDAAVIGGPTVIVYIAHDPRYPHFKDLLFRALARIPSAKRSMEIVSAEVWRVYTDETRVRFKRDVGVPPEQVFPKMLSDERLHVRVRTVVEVVDRQTGIIEKEEVKSGSIFNTMMICKERISEKIHKLEILRASQITALVPMSFYANEKLEMEALTHSS